MKTKETTIVTVRLPNDILNVLDEACFELGWMRSQLIRALLIESAKTLNDKEIAITFVKKEK